jgi:hypothetical protein
MLFVAPCGAFIASASRHPQACRNPRTHAPDLPNGGLARYCAEPLDTVGAIGIGICAIGESLTAGAGTAGTSAMAGGAMT